MRRRFVVPIRLVDLQVEKPLLARIISSSFYLSHGIRGDVVLYFYLMDHPKSVSFNGERLKHVHVDEASLVGILQKIERNIKTGSKKERIHDGVTIEDTPSLGEKTTLLVSNQGIPLERIASRTINDFTYLIPLNNSWRISPDKFTKIRVTYRPKPADVTIAILNIKLDRLTSSPL